MSKLEAALEALDLQDWLSDHVAFKTNNSNEIILETCPICLNSKYKLYVNVEKKLWNCFRCDWGRQLRDVTLLMAAVSGRTKYSIILELLNTVVPTASDNGFFETLKKALEGEVDQEAEESDEIITIPGSTSFTGIYGQAVLAYAKKRGISQEEIDTYGLRCSYSLRNHIGPFLVVPVYWKDTPVRWQGRRVTDKEPRYISSDNIADWVWPISNGTSNLAFKDSVVLVEGTIDALGIRRLGIDSVCTFGKKISKNQINVLKYLGVKKVYLAWDIDARKEIEKAALRLQSMFSVSIVDLSKKPAIPIEGKVDPGRILELPELGDWFISCLDAAIDVDSPEFYTWRLIGSLSL